MKPHSQKVIKPWGYELILTSPESPVTGKLAFTKANHRWSYQYHDKKDEVITLIEGKAEFWLENENGVIEKLPMKIKQGYHVEPSKKHRFCALKNCWTVEVSTPEEGNTIRLEDDYARPSETEKIRKLTNRGWTSHEEKK